MAKLIYEDQDPNCQDAPCPQAPLGCSNPHYCPKKMGVLER